MDNSILASVIGLGSMGLLFGAILAYASRIFRVEVDPRIEQIIEILPGANCGGCGYPGCSGYADALVKNNVDMNLCAPGGADVIAQISAILGKESDATGVEMVAAVQCKGGNAEAKSRFIYHGILDCTAAQMLDSGFKSCVYGCLGLGTCVRACPFDALHINANGLPEVNEAKCTACGLCVKACPRDIMTLIPKIQRIFIGCNSHDRGKSVKNACSVGCIGCTKCATPKVTPSGAILMDNNLPKIIKPDAEDLRAAVESCPTNSFSIRRIMLD
ncbi:Fe-S cluster domain-containing protein [candidate division KSB1 bacterium]|nr:Fe-S cluster domain-containing protein [candidate division KSB1 bacterium]